MKMNLKKIDPELRLMGFLVKLINPTFTRKRLEFMSQFKGKLKSDKHMHLSESWVERQDGTKLRVLVARPKFQNSNLPALLWLHGGGYAIGAPESSLFWVRKIMEASPCVIIIPDYRKSFEAPYPAALEDAYTTLLWVQKETMRLKIKENKLCIGGESAGGGLTAALSLYARDRNEVKIAFQMPLYPMIDDRMNLDSAIDNIAPVWDSKSNYIAWKLYLGDLFETNEIPIYAAPARADSYKNMPTTITFVGDLEPFRDETIHYVQRLKEDHVKVYFNLYEGAYHAFEHISPNAKISKNAVKFVQDAFKREIEKT